MKRVQISTNKERLNVNLIHGFLTEAYWAKGRTIDQVNKCIDNSLNFGIYKDEQQIGYARVVTDYTIFAYLLDVFISKEERGNGYGKKLLNHIINHPKLANVGNWKLATEDAQELYRKLDFEKIKNPENMMERNL